MATKSELEAKQRKHGALLALRNAVRSFLTARAQMDNMASLLGVELNEDADHELVGLAYEHQKVGKALTMDDLAWFLRKVTDDECPECGSNERVAGPEGCQDDFHNIFPQRKK